MSASKVHEFKTANDTGFRIVLVTDDSSQSEGRFYLERLFTDELGGVSWRGISSYRYPNEDIESNVLLFELVRVIRGGTVTPAADDWALNQLAKVGTLVGSHDTAEVLGDVRALVVEVANGDGPLASECVKRLRLANAIESSR